MAQGVNLISCRHYLADEHVRLAIEVAYNIGVRPGESELFALKWTDVDFCERANQRLREKDQQAQGGSGKTGLPEASRS